MGIFRIQTGVCRHCRRPITKPHGWLHTDGIPECMDGWRWDYTGTVAAPDETAAPVPPVRRRWSANDVRRQR